jgi:hypothetical protein
MHVFWFLDDLFLKPFCLFCDSEQSLSSCKDVLQRFEYQRNVAVSSAPEYRPHAMTSLETHGHKANQINPQEVSTFGSMPCY